MKKYLTLFLIITLSSNLFAQEQKMDELIYEYLAKYNIADYPDSTLLIVRCVCFNDTCSLGFYLDENIAMLQRSISGFDQKQLYLYSLKNGKKVLFKAVKSKNKSWLRFFDEDRLKQSSHEEIKKYCSFFNRFRWDQYVELQSEIMLNFFGDRKLWDSEMATIEEFK